MFLSHQFVIVRTKVDVVAVVVVVQTPAALRTLTTCTAVLNTRQQLEFHHIDKYLCPDVREVF